MLYLQIVNSQRVNSINPWFKACSVGLTALLGSALIPKTLDPELAVTTVQHQSVDTRALHQPHHHRHPEFIPFPGEEQQDSDDPFIDPPPRSLTDMEYVPDPLDLNSEEGLEILKKTPRETFKHPPSSELN